MNYAAIKETDIANGSGVRVSLFVSGCDRHCKGCFNSEIWNFDAGEPFDEFIAVKLFKLVDREFISGLSILGGEPLDPRNIGVVGGLVRSFKESLPGKTIWIYTGYKFEEISHNEFIRYVDVIVDGEFIEAEKDISLRFRGSRNQRIIDVKKTLSTGNIELLEV